MSPDVPIGRSALLSVAWAAVDDPAALTDATGVAVTAVGVPVVETSEGPSVAPGVPDAIVATVAGPVVGTALDAAWARQRGFTGRVGENMIVVGALGAPGAPGALGALGAQGSLGADAPAIVFVGCGKIEAVRADVLRRAAAGFVRTAGQTGAAVLIVPASLSEAGGSQHGVVQAVVEGAVLASYHFVSHKTGASGTGASGTGASGTGASGTGASGTGIERFVVAGVGLDPVEVAEGTRRGIVVAGAVCLARDLVNEPPSSLTPTRLAQAAVEYVGGRRGVTVEVWDEQRIADERLGGLLGVARGSAEPPRLLRATYEPADPITMDGRVPHVVLVGKGITFDSGGLSLKTADGMVTMKTDMSGAAAVLAAVSACGEVGVRVRVTAIAPTTENMPGGRAIKPGDVLTIRNGRTIEVLNTDAEGRLVLADGLSLASELRPDAIIDLATLTGACVVALGLSVAGVFGTDDALIGQVRAASERAGEATWPLPMPEDYRSHIDSEIADMKNVGKPGQAGAIAAALLLARFVDAVPWVHLDIAGPARSDEDSGIFAKGGTGFGVRTLLELLEAYGADG